MIRSLRRWQPARKAKMVRQLRFRRKSSRSVQQRRHHFVVAAVRSLELREAGKLHTGQGSTAGGAATSAGRD